MPSQQRVKRDIDSAKSMLTASVAQAIRFRWSERQWVESVASILTSLGTDAPRYATEYIRGYADGLSDLLVTERMELTEGLLCWRDDNASVWVDLATLYGS